MKHIPYNAKKIWEFHDEYVIIKHVGKHTCVAKKLTTVPETISKTFRKSSKTKPSKLQRDSLVQNLRESADINAITELASRLLDKKKAKK